MAALGRRPIGDRAQPAGRLRARPLGRETMRPLWHSTALRGQLRGGDLRVRGVQRGDGRDLIRAERPEREPPGTRQPFGQAGIGAGHNAKERRGREVAGQLGQCASHRVVDVLEHEQRRAPSRVRPRDGVRAVEHEPTLPVHLARQLGGQPRAADPRRAAQDDGRAAAATGLRPRLAQSLEFGHAADQR